MTPQPKLLAFNPDRFVGGDDPATTISALVRIKENLERQVAALQQHKQQLWGPTAGRARHRTRRHAPS